MLYLPNILLSNVMSVDRDYNHKYISYLHGFEFYNVYFIKMYKINLKISNLIKMRMSNF